MKLPVSDGILIVHWCLTLGLQRKLFLDGLSAIKKQRHPYLGGGFLDIFYFHPYLGKIPIFDSYFSDGLVQPPTSHDNTRGVTSKLPRGLVLYLGLVVLFVWRFLSGWRFCGAWMEYANYCMLLGLEVFQEFGISGSCILPRLFGWSPCMQQICLDNLGSFLVK